MEKFTRHRKAFYEKENDFKNGNQKLQLYKSFDIKDQLHNIHPFQFANHEKIPQLQVNRTSKNNTESYCQFYSSELLNSISNYQVPPKFLDRHKIDAGLRARMLDWMVEVMTQYKFTHKAYFAGIQLMDRYFEKETDQLHPSKLHIIGVVSMMISSKMEEVYPLKLKTVYEKIGHKKIPQEQIMNLEARISYTLNFKLNSWTFFDLAVTKIHILLQILTRRRLGALTNITNNYFSSSQNERNLIKQIQEKLPQIEQTLSYISKFVIYDYDFYCSGSLSLFSDVIIKLCFEVLKIPSHLEVIFTSPPIEVELFKEQLKEKIRKYDQRFKGISNLKKFTNFELINLVDKQVYLD